MEISQKIGANWTVRRIYELRINILLFYIEKAAV
jgi:hypothetical protein